MFSITINVIGDKEEIAKLKKLGSDLHDFSSAMREIGDHVVKYYGGEAFASQGGVYDDRWASLSPAYASRKARKYPGRGILVATGAMQRGFNAKPSINSVDITNSVPYFVYHQSTAPRSKMPYRPMMQINDRVRNIVKEVIQQDINRKLARV